MALQYKFVELSIVTDETLETCVNEWVAQGWALEGIRFVMTEHSKRPSMAFVSFIREADAEVADTTAPRTPPPLLRAVPLNESLGDSPDASPDDLPDDFVEP